MLIGSIFKRPKAPIEMPGKTYFFVPIDPSNPDSEHVAEVTDEAHIQRFMQIPEGYYISKAQALPTTSKPAPAAPTPAPAPASASTPAADTSAEAGASAAADAGAETSTSTSTAETGTADASDSTAPSGLPQELENAAKVLNGLTWQKLNAELKAGGIDKAVIQRALDIELALPEVDQRGTTVKILKQNLGIA